MSKTLNGSSDLLAKAIRKVFEETQEIAVGLMEDGFKEVNQKIDKLDSLIDITNKNMAAQFSQQKEDISNEIEKQLSK